MRWGTFINRFMGVCALALSLIIGSNVMAQPQIQQIKTPKGITVWLVESHQIPIISLEVDFRAGSAYDPKGHEGLANFTATLLDEGSGNMDANAFKEALDDIGARLGANADTTDLNITLNTLTENRAAAFKLLGQSLQSPRFDDEAVVRMRTSILSGLKRAEEDPGTVASRAYYKKTFGTHPYAHPVQGTPASVAKFNGQLAREFWAKNVNRANMVVSVVGDITAAEVEKLVDESLGNLPAGTVKNPDFKAPAKPVAASVTHIQKDVPQASVIMGHFGLPRSHPDFWNMLVANELLGGGVLTSRLYKSVREEHGLAYSVRSGNYPLPGAGDWQVSVETGNATTQQAIALIRKEIERMRTTEVDAKEFNDVIDYLVGSFPLRTDTNRKILGYLSMMQMENLGPDYMTNWVERVKAVKPADIQRVAKEYFHPDAMALVIVGDGPALKAK
ncbi:MAG TPA: pitrilysin family protein [Alphaproteobacteria bacterium]|nr:pitrilysin family protein [Alphaproteobacteria bacterium]